MSFSSSHRTSVSSNERGELRNSTTSLLIYIYASGRGFAARLSQWRSSGGAKACRSVRKRSSLTARAQHCSEKTDRESGGCKGWQYDPLLGGSDYNKIYTHIYACPGPRDRSYGDCRYSSKHLEVYLYISKCLFYFF